MKLFDTRSMGQNERFMRVTLIMVPFSMVIGLFFGALNDVLVLEFSVLYILVGVLIGFLVMKIGRGAQMRFRYLAVACTLLSILTADILYPVLFYQIGILTSAKMALHSLLEGPSGMISILFRVLSLSAAYSNSV